MRAFVQEPMKTWSTSIPTTSSRGLTLSGEYGHATWRPIFPASHSYTEW